MEIQVNGDGRKYDSQDSFNNRYTYPALRDRVRGRTG
jgi:hypothetical protein